MCADAAGELPEGVIKDAYTFLQQQGCINMGVPAEDKEREEAPEAFPTDDDIIQGLQEILENADLEVRCPVGLQCSTCCTLCVLKIRCVAAEF